MEIEGPNARVGDRSADDTAIPILSCSEEEKRALQKIASSTTAGIWRIKRAKIILGTLEGKNVDRLVKDVRVPPKSIIKCLQIFSKVGMGHLDTPSRTPTSREASVERILALLDRAPDPGEEAWDTLTHRYIGIYFSARQIKAIRDLIASNPRYTRADVAREVCSRFGLYQVNGKAKLGFVAGILKRMEMDNLIALPAIARKSWSNRSHIEISQEGPREMLELDPHDIAELRFLPVETKEQARLWNEMIYRHHYIKTYRLFGAQIRYLVYGDKHLLAVLGFASCAWRLSSRDEFIGWNDDQRIANLRYVVSNARFLILPWIKSPNLASRILGGIVRRIPRDWEDRYRYRPVLLETFVQLDRFTGACYKAANWIPLGATSGYSLYGTKEKGLVPQKAVFVYPLTRKFRRVLCGGAP